MKIGIDVQSTRGNPTGLGIYTENLVKALRNNAGKDFSFYYYQRAQGNGMLNTPSRWFWENIELPNRVKEDSLDLLHVPAFCPPWKKPCRLIVTVHDLIGTLYPNQMGVPSRLYWGKWLPFAVSQAERLIADSEHTKQDVMRVLKLPEKKVKVVYPSGHEGFTANVSEEELRETRSKFGIPAKYFLFVGTLEPRKNLSRALEAFGLFCEKYSKDYTFVVVGSKSFAHGLVYRRLRKEIGLQKDKVLFTGYVLRNELNALYRGAEAFIFPSLYEGFGIPVLEAMASGTPVIASNATSIPEVGGDAAFYVDPKDPHSILEGLIKVASDDKLRHDLVNKGFEQIKKFSWDETAKQVLDVYQETL